MQVQVPLVATNRQSHLDFPLTSGYTGMTASAFYACTSLMHDKPHTISGNSGCFPLHYDSDESVDARRVTAILYLNPGWEPAHGGELQLFPWPRPPVTIPPLDNRLVIFSTCRMLHRSAGARLQIAKRRISPTENASILVDTDACVLQGAAIPCRAILLHNLDVDHEPGATTDTHPAS